MKTPGPDCDWCGASGEDGDLDITLVGDDFLCDYCLQECDRAYIPATGKTGVQAWEIAPCLRHFDPHDGSDFVETYETIQDAREASCDGEGAIFWGVYAVMRQEYHSDVIAPTIHIMDFDTRKDAGEFVRAMIGEPTERGNGSEWKPWIDR